MKARAVPNRSDLVALFVLPIAWIVPWLVYSLAIIVGDVEISPNWIDAASVRWWWFGAVIIPLVASIISWFGGGSVKRWAGVLVGTFVIYAMLAIAAMVLVVSVWTLIDGPFLEGF